MELNQKKLKEVLSYDKHTGEFTWIKKPYPNFPIKIGTVAGTINGRGYVRIRVYGKDYQAHRLVWLYIFGKWPDKNIDHINRIKTDNRLINLRDVDQYVNVKNSGLGSNNKTGIKGVYFDKSRKKWAVQITINKLVRSLGRFDDFFEACCARKRGEIGFG